ncbi:hypothetical protein AZC_2159 [Azorhizobium caulinodans ORS 571]|uniref:Uncharacterized protein n=1 Tax=Azorhizobium caulinodans (strain ATCC 43989 / DSM 5975 / JCM 20966 / LMG 6465 / NBRC 14845 / NCIMB 13405 / ORS 571) TaxID=438753 RepID=A8I7T3_AZOC5|nr:hypothetical protein [Azorhizobium caulinodans]BAF88157.1 hypothetical protein AZC_2159 [Azorhizobium caulinodans ORS 571]
MTRIVSFTEAEVAEPQDFGNISLYAREGDDHIVGGAIDYAHHWADFSISQPSSIELRINPGRLFAGAIVYAAEEPIDLNLQIHLPLVTGDRRYVALLLRGATRTLTAQRMIETDAETGETVEQAVPKTESRIVEVVIQQGLPSPTPLKPSVAADQCCLAFVELAPTGIVAVELDHGSRLKSLAEVEGRLTTLEGEVSNTIRRTTTLETDVANIASRLTDIPHPTIIRQLKRDVANVRRQLAMPDEARAYWYDAGLVQDAWDLTHATWLARVREGIRFPWAAERDSQLALLDPGSAALRMSGTLLLPAWEEAVRIEVPGDGGSTNISQLTHTVTTAVRREIARQVVEYGETVTVCENNAEWATSYGRSVGELFTVKGETFEVVAIAGNTEWAGHVLRAVRRIITRTVTDVYWDYVTESFGVNGSIYGQTWLCAQPMILTSIDLSFTRVGSSGDVHLFVCECDDTGQPRLDRVIVTTTLAAKDLAAGWVTFPLRPSLLESGRRYAWATVTTGNHALETVAGNRFAQGSRFTCTDGAWSQISTEVDFAMRIKAATFAAPRTVVEFAPLTLENGMTELRLLHGGWAPGGTALTWEVKPSTSNAWQPLTLADVEGGDTLAGLPALVQLRAVFVGTTDLQPAIVLDAKARGMTFRPRGEMIAVSRSQAFGLATSTIQLEVVVDAYDASRHNMQLRLVVGASILSPSAVSLTPDLVNPKKRTVLATFILGAPVTEARARVDMTTTTVTDVPFIQNIALYAL